MANTPARTDTEIELAVGIARTVAQELPQNNCRTVQWTRSDALLLCDAMVQLSEENAEMRNDIARLQASLSAEVNK